MPLLVLLYLQQNHPVRQVQQNHNYLAETVLVLLEVLVLPLGRCLLEVLLVLMVLGLRLDLCG